MKKDAETLVIMLVLTCLIFDPETARNICAALFAIFFFQRWIR
jgi:hypothetical protein